MFHRGRIVIYSLCDGYYAQIFAGNNLSKDETDAELAKVKRELAELRAKEIVRSEAKSTTPRSARKSKNMESSSSDNSTEPTDHSVSVSISISIFQLITMAFAF